MIGESFIDASLDGKEGFISTGIEKLDRLLEGGIPNGFTTVILGSPGSSTEILVKQIASVGNVTYVANDDPLPIEQEGRVFLFEEDGCDEHLENMTNATGAILIWLSL